MELLSLFLVVVMLAFSYILGYRQKEKGLDTNYKSGNTKYKSIIFSQIQINQDHYEEEALIERTPQPKTVEEVNTKKDTLIKDQQKEIDRLIRDLTDMKKREQKNMAEIQYLKTKISSSSVTAPSKYNQSDGKSNKFQNLKWLITDKGFSALLDEASQKLKNLDDIDEDELSKQIDEQLQ